MNASQIKTWLRQSGHDRQWLSTQLGVAKSTVDGWLSGRPIPRPIVGALNNLMFQGQTLSPKFTMEEFDKMSLMARQAGMTLDEWLARVVVERLKEGHANGQKEASAILRHRVPRIAVPK